MSARSGLLLTLIRPRIGLRFASTLAVPIDFGMSTLLLDGPMTGELDLDLVPAREGYIIDRHRSHPGSRVPS